jgi:NitT/TauT family transport system permease protein
MLGDPRFAPHLRETLLAFGQGFVIAVVVGLLIRVPLGAARFAGEVAEPILVALYSIPKVTLYPVILLIFGIGMPAKVAFAGCMRAPEGVQSRVTPARACTPRGRGSPCR